MKIQTTRTATVFALILALHVPAAALARAVQEPAEAGAAALPEAKSLMDRSMEVTNVGAVIEKTSCMHRTGKLTMPAMGMEGTIDAWSRKPNVNVTHTRMGAMGEMSQGFDGRVGWRMSAMDGARISEGAELLLMKLEANYGAVKDRDMFESIETVAREQFEGKDCYNVKLVAKPLEGMDPAKTLKNRTFHEFYDAETGLLAGRVNVVSNPQMGEMEMTLVVSDYQEFGDGLFATKLTQRTPMFEIMIQWTSIDFPGEVDEATFALPKEIAEKIEKSK